MRALHTNDWAQVRGVDMSDPEDDDWIATNDIAAFDADAEPGIIQPPPGSDGRVRLCVFFYNDGADPTVDPATIVPHGANLQVTVHIIQRVERMRSLHAIQPPMLVKLDEVEFSNQGGQNEATLGPSWKASELDRSWRCASSA